MSNVDKIARLRREADELEAADKVFSELPDVKKLAISLHKTLCRHNHVDACGWEYEVGSAGKPDNWGGYAHSEYLRKATNVEAFCKQNGISISQALGLIAIIHTF